MSAVVECEGAPRDLGFDQGRACRAALDSALARAHDAAEVGGWGRLWRRLAPHDAESAAVELDLRRHFPQLWERLAGLARGGRVARPALVRALSALFACGANGAPSEGDGALITTQGHGRAFAIRDLAGELVVRRSRPEVGHRSLEVTPVWLVSALAGVNERGLAVAAVPARGRPLPARSKHSSRAPAVLAVQECLQRFETVDSALDWCLRRPAGGNATVVALDARGDAAAVELAGGRVRVRRPESGLLVAPGRSRDAGALEKAAREGSPFDPVALARSLSPAASAALVMDPRGRRLALLRLADAPEALAWLAV